MSDENNRDTPPMGTPTPTPPPKERRLYEPMSEAEAEALRKRSEAREPTAPFEITGSPTLAPPPPPIEKAASQAIAGAETDEAFLASEEDDLFDDLFVSAAVPPGPVVLQAEPLEAVGTLESMGTPGVVLPSAPGDIAAPEPVVSDQMPTAERAMPSTDEDTSSSSEADDLGLESLDSDISALALAEPDVVSTSTLIGDLALSLDDDLFGDDIFLSDKSPELPAAEEAEMGSLPGIEKVDASSSVPAPESSLPAPRESELPQASMELPSTAVISAMPPALEAFSDSVPPDQLAESIPPGPPPSDPPGLAALIGLESMDSKRPAATPEPGESIQIDDADVSSIPPSVRPDVITANPADVLSAPPSTPAPASEASGPPSLPPPASGAPASTEGAHSIDDADVTSLPPSIPPAASAPPSIAPASARDEAQVPSVSADIAPATPFGDLDVEIPDIPEDFDQPAIAAPKLAPTPRGPDLGAAAARRTVRRRARAEHLPLVGTKPEALVHRAALLDTLATKTEGPERAGLLTAAAELLERASDRDGAMRRYKAAVEADEQCVVALRALRRLALSEQRWSDLAVTMETECDAVTNDAERLGLLCMLAELYLVHLNNPEAALSAAGRASRTDKDALLPLLLSLQAAERSGAPHAVVVRGRAAEALAQHPARSMLELRLGLDKEEFEGSESAAVHFDAAAAIAPNWMTLIAAIRGARARGDGDAVVEHLMKLRDSTPSAPLIDLLERSAVRFAHLSQKDAATALQLGSGLESELGLQSLASAARASENIEAEIDALGRLVAVAGGTERSLALCRLAELSDDPTEIDQLLRDAVNADDSVGIPKIVRELRLRQQVNQAHDMDPDECLALAGRAGPSKSEEEEEYLRRHSAADGASPFADIILLELSAARNNTAGLVKRLRKRVERLRGERKLGTLLAIAERDEDHADVLTESARHAPAAPEVWLEHVQRFGRSSPDSAVDPLAAYVGVTSGLPGAWAAEVAASLAQDKDVRRSFLDRARELSPEYLPASWGLIADTNEADPELSAILEGLAGEVSGSDRAALLVRAADASSDQERRATLLQTAATSAEDDPLIHELVAQSTVGAVDPAFVQRTSARANQAQASTIQRLRSALALDMAEQHAAAIPIYESCAESKDFGSLVESRIQHCLLASEGPTAFATRLRAQLDALPEGDPKRRGLTQDLARTEPFSDDDKSETRWESILRTDPEDIEALLELETRYMRSERFDALVPIELGLATVVQEPAIAVAHARVALRLARLDKGPGVVADELAQTTGWKTSPWLARRVLQAAVAEKASELTTEAHLALAATATAPDERTMHVLSATRDEPTPELIDQLREACAETPDHPVALEELARMLSASEQDELAAQAFEDAARATRVPSRTVRLWHRAGTIWQDKLKDNGRARGALAQAAAIDVKYSDTFDRLRRLLKDAGELDDLRALIERRIEAGADPAIAVDLQLSAAALAQKREEPNAARNALVAALELDPQNLEALRELVHLSQREGDWKTAAQALIRIARLRRDREELRWVFFSLGEIYDEHIPDFERAEAAFQRVIKLIPEDLEALDRLARVYEKAELQPQAEIVLKQMVELELDPDENLAHRLRLAHTFEARGDSRKAEAALEEARRNAPTDLNILRALADFYNRDGAQPALSMHLSRAVRDFQRALSADPSDKAAWLGLVEVLEWRRRRDAARACAAAATALGITDIELSKRVDPNGGIPGAAQNAFRPEVIERLAPGALSRATRQVFRICTDTFDRVLPFDLQAQRATRRTDLGGFREPMEQIASWIGGEIELWQTDAAPRICVPVGNRPTTILVGYDLEPSTTPDERLFLLTRAAVIATLDMSVTVRSQPADLNLVLASLVRSFDPMHAPAGVDVAQLDTVTKRLAKIRSSHDDLMALTYEMAHAPDFDASLLGIAASELANRVALVATGNPSAALSGLLKLAALDLSQVPTVPQRVETLRRVPEARALLDFAAADLLFDVRSLATVGDP